MSRGGQRELVSAYDGAAVEQPGRNGVNGDERRRVIYCIVPRELAPKLYDHLRSHWRDDDSIRVVAERRSTERRGADRRHLRAGVEEEQRVIRNVAGRRVADRRAITLAGEPPRLPRRARPYADRLLFVERFEPTDQKLLDIEADRLVIRIQSGDRSEDAMSELYLRNFDQVYGYARLALRDAHEAEDVAQQVFVKLLQAIPRYEIRPTCPFRAWLFRIARNEIANSFRGRQRLSVEDPQRIDFRRDEPVSQEVETMLAWVSDGDLSLFIERLPTTQREVLVLRYMLDLTVQEIAAVIGRTPKAIRRLQERALATLEQRLVAVGRKPEGRGGRSSMLVRVKPIPVMTARRFALGGSALPPAVRSGRRAA